MKIINFFGGPGIGKSTIASFVFSHLKLMKKYNIELVTEYAKDCVYEGKIDILKNDQLYVFAKQNHKLKMIQTYSNNVDFVITDSPLLLSNIYGEINNSIDDNFKKFVISVFNSYENINFFINRDMVNDYENSGRIQSNDDAINIHNKIKNYLNENNINYNVISTSKNLIDCIDKIFKIIGI